MTKYLFVYLKELNVLDNDHFAQTIDTFRVERTFSSGQAKAVSFVDNPKRIPRGYSRVLVGSMSSTKTKTPEPESPPSQNASLPSFKCSIHKHFFRIRLTPGICE